MGQLFIILIVLAGGFALLQAIRIKDTFARTINLIFAVSIALTFVPITALAAARYSIFILGCLCVVLYAFSDGNFSTMKKTILIGMGGLQLAAMLFFAMRWPGTDILFYSTVLTVIAYIFIVTKDIREYQIEIGFLTVLMVDALIKSMMVFSSSDGIFGNG